MPHRSAALLLLGWAAGCAGLYEEDAGRWDWVHATFGTITHAEFPSAASGVKGRAGRMVFVAGDGGTVGAVALKTGAIVWRRLLRDGESVSALHVATPHLLLAIAVLHDREAPRALLFSLDDGALLWEDDIVPRGRVIGVVPESANKWPSVVTLHRDGDAPQLTFHSIETEGEAGIQWGSVTDMGVGKVRWAGGPDPSLPAAAAAFAVTPGAVALVTAGADGGAAQLHALSLDDEKWQDPLPLPLPRGLPARVTSVCGKGLVVTAGSGGGASHSAVVDVKTRQAAAVPAAYSGEGWAYGCSLPRRKEDGAEDDAAAVLGVAVKVDGDELAFRARSAAAPAEASADVEWDLPDVPLARHGGARRVWVAPGDKGWRALAVLDDGAAVGAAGGAQKGKRLWVRDDAVGQVVDAVATDIPHSADGGVADGGAVEQLSYAQLLAEQVQAVSEFAASFPKRAQRFVDDVTKRDQPPAEGDAKPAGGGGAALVADKFGLQRIIVVATEKSVVALHTGDGRAVWRRHVATALNERGLAKAGESAKVMRLLKSTSEETEWPMLYAWVRIGEGNPPAGRDAVLHFHHVTGKVLAAHAYPTKMVSGAVVASVRHREGTEGVPYASAVFIDAEHRVHTYPSEPSVAAAVDGSSRRVWYHEMHIEASTLSGHVLQSGAAESAWSIRLDRVSGERIVATSLQTHDPFQYVVKDNVRVLHNKTTNKGDVFTKYINPNAVLVVTHVPDAVAKGTDEGAKKHTGGYLVFYLIDGVTGALLQSMVQTNAHPPVQVIAVEHMFVYTFLNTKRVRYQVGVWELFDDLDKYRGLTGESTTSAKYLLSTLTGQYNKEHLASAFEQPPPQLFPLAFSFPSAARALATTTSEKGIQPKHLICALATDDIVVVDLPRHMQAHQAGVTAMGWAPTSILSHNRSAHGIRRLRTFPTRLESTSLVLGSGHDLFFSRVAPGKPFDVLGEDFNHSMLILTLLVVTGATYVLSLLTHRKKLRQQWT